MATDIIVRERGPEQISGSRKGEVGKLPPRTVVGGKCCSRCSPSVVYQLGLLPSAVPVWGAGTNYVQCWRSRGLPSLYIRKWRKLKTWTSFVGIGVFNPNIPNFCAQISNEWSLCRLGQVGPPEVSGWPTWFTACNLVSKINSKLQFGFLKKKPDLL